MDGCSTRFQELATLTLHGKAQERPDIVWMRGWHLGAVNFVSFSSDGQYLISASADRTAKIWRVSDENLVRTFVGHSSGVNCAVFSPDGNYAVVTPLSSDDAYRSETPPNSKYDRSNLSPSQDSYADNDAQTNNPQHAHANTDANATSCAQTHTIPQPHPTNTPASQTHASCASNSSDDPAAPRSTAPREPHTDTLSATPTHNAPPHPPPCPDNDA
jgi:WD40 repeat protein